MPLPWLMSTDSVNAHILGSAELRSVLNATLHSCTYGYFRIFPILASSCCIALNHMTLSYMTSHMAYLHVCIHARSPDCSPGIGRLPVPTTWQAPPTPAMACGSPGGVAGQPMGGCLGIAEWAMTQAYPGTPTSNGCLTDLNSFEMLGLQVF